MAPAPARRPTSGAPNGRGTVYPVLRLRSGGGRVPGPRAGPALGLRKGGPRVVVPRPKSSAPMPQKPEADRPPEGGRRLTLSWCGRTSKGLVRSNNEDTLWAHGVAGGSGKGGNSDGRVDSAFPGLLCSVADGMGGALAGEVASGLAVSVVASEMSARIAQAREGGALLDEWCLHTLVAAVEAAN